MNKGQRIKNVLLGVLYIFFAIAMAIVSDIGYLIVLVIISFSAVIKGISLLIYYFTMAKYMVDGRMIFYQGIILLNFGIITRALSDIPKYYIMVYLMVILIFKGVIDILRALEAKKLEAPSWKGTLILGILTIIIPVASLFTPYNMRVLIYAFCITILISGISKIINAFKKTTLLYIP